MLVITNPSHLEIGATSNTVHDNLFITYVSYGPISDLEIT